MKTYPIIFPSESVPAILRDTTPQTQTRRVVKLRPREAFDHTTLSAAIPYHPSRRVSCPYGKAGDQLRVRERFKFWEDPEDGYDYVVYSDDTRQLFPNDDHALDGYKLTFGPWYGPLSMPSWASRIRLEVTGVRVERLTDISLEDISAELGKPLHLTGYSEFIEHWDGLNRKRGYPWTSKHTVWVWVISFKRVVP